MRILLINWQDINNPLSGGAEVYMHEIFKRIVSAGNEVTLLCSSFDGAKEREDIDGLNVVRMGSRGLFNFYVPLKINQLTEEKKLDCREAGYDIIIEDLNKVPFFTPLYFNKIPRLNLVMHLFGPAIYRETNFLFGAYINMGERMIPPVYRKEIFCVLSKSTKDELISKGIVEKNISIISPAIPETLKPDFNNKSTSPTVLLYGRMKKYKCPDVVLYVMKEVVSKIPDAKLVVMGRGDYLPELKNISSKLGLEKNIEFLGFVPEEEKDKILQSSWVMMNTSLKEGWGITNIEANACGTPVVANNSPGLQDSVVDGKTGFLVNNNDVKELADKVIKILQDKSLRENLSRNSVEWSKNFTWDDAAQKMLELISKTIQDS